MVMRSRAWRPLPMEFGPMESGSLLPPRGRRAGADNYAYAMGDAVMKHKFRRLVNMEFSFYKLLRASESRRRFSAIATVSAMAKAMLAESERKPA